MRHFSDRELTHERLGDRFETELSQYDTQQRLALLVDDFLGRERLAGRSALEVGCGLGFFSERLQHHGARVVATDIGDDLLRRVRARVGCECRKVDALGLVDEFGPSSFDVVLSSECIEHTPEPEAALRQMARVLKPGGLIAVSTPNFIWYPAVRAATLLGVRKFDGLENFSSFRTIRRTLSSEGVVLLQEKGLHLFPFQIPLHRLSMWCDKNLQLLRPFMINICVLGRKH